MIERTSKLEMLSLVASKTDNAVIITDSAGRIEWVNEGFERITEYSAKEVNGSKPGEFLQGTRTDQATISAMGEQLHAGAGFRGEIVNYSKSGREYWLELDIQPIHDEQGQLIRFIAIESDITDRKRSEAELHDAKEAAESANQATSQFMAKLRSTEERLRLILDTALDAVITMDDQGWITSWNRKAEEIFGWTSDQAIGRKLSQTIVPPDLREAHERGLAHYMQSGEGPVLGTRIEVPALHREGRTFPCELSIVPLPIGNEMAFSGFIRDISERKQAEEDLRNARDTAESANRAKSEFLANMSHEIRTPLHGLLSFAGFGMKKVAKAEPDKLAKYFQKIDASGRQLLLLVNDLLDLAKLESGKMDFEFAQSDVGQFINNVVDEFSSLVSERGISVGLNGPQEPIHAQIDETKMMQVVRNLLNNALKFTSTGGEIEITYRLDGKVLSVRIRDHGPGIPDEEVQTIFDKFIQSSKTKSGAGGTGLGLSICAQIIEAHHGRIWAENHPEGGAVVCFDAPISREQSPAAGCTEMAAAA